ncbi:hypothetical protein [Rhizobium rhizogenes]|uniref:hypothetical protein n=1 Tax=Rhizobium rhizogenes TaxID=359 RepID=UPI001572462A|nr:hypothetical protein [Rhizobium rhizogenes]NTF46533.1 hypothetical protein [Rhizobium rhizogenes]
MLLDESRSPLIFLRVKPESDMHINQQLERLLDRRKAFVLITDHAPDDHEDETPAERKEKALFFKRIKDRMRQYCRGMIVVEGATPTNAAMRLAASAAGKAFGFSIQFAADEQDAVARGMALLAKDAA